MKLTIDFRLIALDKEKCKKIVEQVLSVNMKDTLCRLVDNNPMTIMITDDVATASAHREEYRGHRGSITVYVGTPVVNELHERLSISKCFRGEGLEALLLSKI